MQELRQRAPLEAEAKDEIEAEAGMPREESAIQRELGLRYVRQLNDQFLPEVMRLDRFRRAAGLRDLLRFHD